MCDECESQHTWCVLCRRKCHEESTCRHVFKCSGTAYEWAGAGAEAWQRESTDQICRESFEKCLDFMGADFAADLKTALRRHRYHFQFGGDLVGEAYLDTSLDGQLRFDLRRRWTDGLTGAQELAMTAGVHWLVSLWAGGGDFPATREADALTVKWIREWEKRPRRAIRYVDGWHNTPLDGRRWGTDLEVKIREGRPVAVRTNDYRGDYDLPGMGLVAESIREQLGVLVTAGEWTPMMPGHPDYDAFAGANRTMLRASVEPEGVR
jgi:hypothetical protein